MKNAITRWTLAAVTAASLGFGATQAVAAPAAEDAARACNPRGCNASCQAQGGFEGRCTEGGQCLCLL